MEVDPAVRSLVVADVALGSPPCSVHPPEQTEWSPCRYTPVPTACAMFVQPIETSAYALYPRARFLILPIRPAYISPSADYPTVVYATSHSLPPPDRHRSHFVSRTFQTPVKSLNTQQFLYRHACGETALRLFTTIVIPLLRIPLL